MESRGRIFGDRRRTVSGGPEHGANKHKHGDTSPKQRFLVAEACGR